MRQRPAADGGAPHRLVVRAVYALGIHGYLDIRPSWEGVNKQANMSLNDISSVVMAVLISTFTLVVPDLCPLGDPSILKFVIYTYICLCDLVFTSIISYDFTTSEQTKPCAPAFGPLVGNYWPTTLS